MVAKILVPQALTNKEVDQAVTVRFGQCLRVFALLLLKFGVVVAAEAHLQAAHAVQQDGAEAVADIVALVLLILCQVANTLSVQAMVVLAVVRGQVTGLTTITAVAVAVAALHMLLDSI